MNRRINIERVILAILVIFTIFLMISHIQVTADLNQRIKSITQDLKNTNEKNYNLEQQNSFLEERVNLLKEAFKDIKK